MVVERQVLETEGALFSKVQAHPDFKEQGYVNGLRRPRLAPEDSPAVLVIEEFDAGLPPFVCPTQEFPVAQPLGHAFQPIDEGPRMNHADRPTDNAAQQSPDEVGLD